MLVLDDTMGGHTYMYIEDGYVYTRTIIQKSPKLYVLF